MPAGTYHDRLTMFKPDVLWWDTPTWMTKERADRLIPLVRLVSGMIHNNRLGGGYRGDTEVSVIKLETVGALECDPVVLRQAADGAIVLDRPGTHKLAIKPAPQGWQPLNLRAATLAPVNP